MKYTAFNGIRVPEGEVRLVYEYDHEYEDIELTFTILMNQKVLMDKLLEIQRGLERKK